MAASIDLSTPAGQAEWKKGIEKENGTRAAWLAEYGPEEYRLPPKMVKVKIGTVEAIALNASAREAPTAATPAEETPEEIIRRMRFATNSRENFYNMHDSKVHQMAMHGLQAGKFNRRKTMEEI